MLVAGFIIVFVIGVVLGVCLNNSSTKMDNDSYERQRYSFRHDEPYEDLVEERTYTFEEIWLKETKHHDYDAIRTLSDNDYIEYHKWEKEHSAEMYEKHLPNHIVFRGDTGPTKLIFHGGCLRCDSQENFGVERCKGCQYFRANWGLPDLSRT